MLNKTGQCLGRTLNQKEIGMMKVFLNSLFPFLFSLTISLDIIFFSSSWDKKSTISREKTNRNYFFLPSFFS